MLDKASY